MTRAARRTHREHPDQEGTDRERTASRLLVASAEHSYDPTVHIDWDTPLLAGRYFCPPERISLYGTPLWDQLTEQQRIELSRYEVASIASVGIWFETVLMQLLIRYVYDRDPTAQHVQYALTEVGEECRHSVMFARMIEKLGCPHYPVPRRNHELARVYKSIAAGPDTWAAVLVAEEILDALQRECMADDRVQPLVRAVCRIHVIEEARHVRFARAELVRQWERTSAPARTVARLLLARMAYVVATSLVHPQVYAAVGLDPRQARAAARTNPQAQATTQWAAARLVSFFTELGLIEGPGRLLWRRANLIG